MPPSSLRSRCPLATPHTTHSPGTGGGMSYFSKKNFLKFLFLFLFRKNYVMVYDFTFKKNYEEIIFIRLLPGRND